MITVEKYIQASKIYSDALDAADVELKKIISGKRNSFGLVDDQTKKTEEFKKANNRYKYCFNLYREFNKSIPKKVKKQMSEIRRRKRHETLNLI